MKKSTNIYVLDSYALLAYIYDEPGVQVVEDLFNDAKKRKIKLLLSYINLGEVFYVLLRKLGEYHTDNLIAIIENLTITILDADKTRIMAAATIKARGGLSYADCFAAALAAEHNATLVTGDPEFKRVEKDIAIKWI